VATKLAGARPARAALRVVAPWPGCGARECVLPCCRPGRGAFSRMPWVRGRDWEGWGGCRPCPRLVPGAFVAVNESARWGRSRGLGTVAACTPIRIGFSPLLASRAASPLSLLAEGEAVDGQDQEQAGAAAGARRCRRGGDR